MAEEEKNTVSNLEAEDLETQPNDVDEELLQIQANDVDEELLQTEPNDTDVELLEDETFDLRKFVNETVAPDLTLTTVCAIVISLVSMFAFTFFFQRFKDATTTAEKDFYSAVTNGCVAVFLMACLFFFYSMREWIYYGYRVAIIFFVLADRGFQQAAEDRARRAQHSWSESEEEDEARQGDAPVERSNMSDPLNEPKASSSIETECFADPSVPEDDSDGRLQGNDPLADTRLVRRAKTSSHEQSNPDTATG